MLVLNVEYSIGQHLSYLLLRWKPHRFTNHFSAMIFCLFQFQLFINLFSTNLSPQLLLCSLSRCILRLLWLFWFGAKVTRQFQWKKTQNFMWIHSDSIARNGQLEPDWFDCRYWISEKCIRTRIILVIFFRFIWLSALARIYFTFFIWNNLKYSKRV